MKHITKVQLEACRQGDCGWLEKRRVEKHIRECAQCRALSEEVAQDRVLLARLKGSVDLYQSLAGKVSPEPLISRLATLLGPAGENVISSEHSS